MKPNRLYYTGLVPRESRLPDISGQGWKAVLVSARSNAKHSSYGREHEIGVLAHSRTSAQKALNLIFGAHNVLSGGAQLFDRPPSVEPADAAELSASKEEQQATLAEPSYCMSAGDFPLACHMAARISRSRKRIYALTLLQQSEQLHFNHPMDLEPRYYPYEHRSMQPADHVRFAYAVVIAYAVLEQLGFALHGEAFQNGGWKPSKRRELEARLLRSHIDLAEPVSWLKRGGKSKLEVLRSTPVSGKCSWSYGAVRDSDVLIVDAIAEVRWLRSRVSAHKIYELADVLSTHDVSNAQFLARRLLLESMGYFGPLADKVREAAD